VTILQYDENGCLLPGEHEMTWREFERMFAYNEARGKLLSQLMDFIEEYCRGCCFSAIIGGSYVTNKEQPNDIDVAFNFGRENPSLYERNQAQKIIDNRDQIKRDYGLDAFFGVAWKARFQRFRPLVMNLQAMPSNHKGTVKIQL